MARPATAAVRLLTGEREPVRLATTANITLHGLQNIDGVATYVGDRVLVKNQTDASENGIYTASEGQWFRAADARTARTMQKGTTVHVQQGAASADFVYAFETLNPVIGTDAITLAFFLSEDTLGDATAAAAAAANSAAAALTSKNAAATSATNAGTSATAASGSATAAAGSASTAATSATNAGTSASAASGSASGAATSATNAGNSATAAAGSASAASGSATAASTSATNAATSATNAAASATAAANSVAALSYTFSTTTTDADPGNGTLRLNNATAASATAAYIDNLDSDGVLQTAFLDTFDDSTNTVRGVLTIRSKTSAAVKYAFNVSGSVVDGSGYRKVALAYVSGSGSMTNGMACWLTFDRTGDKGADGSGTGDFTGPASSTTSNLVGFNDTTGKAGKDSGLAAASVATGPASAVSGNLPSFNGTGGKTLQDSGVAASNVAKLNTANAFTAGQGINTTAGQAIGVTGGPAAGTSGLIINAITGVGNAAFMSFNRNGAYAAHLGIDTDNKWKVGGWSMGANAYEIVHMGNYTTLLDARYALAANIGSMAARAVTISTASPSGGADGDFWAKI
ncbi:hypothetical protein [Mesorhizobium loti]|uniref:Uncharacterized protein n=1 Tax=Rhizobium loti TaxID=381 RepID=A0A6M7U2D6_RHILI|nr:hypothetical protein [Mesorhizobium loti]OBQ66967.1 hypothetical protein A8145_31835 [Mesorhizobium loti]QKC70746.1 hypothetical protein EB815_17640 [Mesorhizobium loti]